MINLPSIQQVAPQQIAALYLTVARDEIRTVMGPSIQELHSIITEQNVAVTGPLLTYHLKRPTEVFELEIAFPVETPITARGRAKPSTLRAATVAQTFYYGPYEGLATAWCELQNWIIDNGYTAELDLWERYLIGPESSVDASTWCTELNQPLAI